MSPGASKLLELRHQLGLSQEEFARRIGASASHVSYIESGQRHVADKVADALRICYGLQLPPTDDKALYESLMLSPKQVRIQPNAPVELFLLLAAFRDVIHKLPLSVAMEWREMMLEAGVEFN
jgi:transcriptional regulator with XRE-family HTH domain